jgi:hypothetical protein
MIRRTTLGQLRNEGNAPDHPELPDSQRIIVLTGDDAITAAEHSVGYKIENPHPRFKTYALVSDEEEMP